MNASDIYALLSLIVKRNKSETLRDWSARTGLSKTSLERCLKRLKISGFVLETVNGNKVVFKNVEEFILHGFKYVFPIKRGGLGRGVLTGIEASSLSNEFVKAEYPLVWPHYKGTEKGYIVSPLHEKVPELVILEKMDKDLYEMLALLDVLRVGQMREQEAAKKRFIKLLSLYEKH